MRTVEEIWDILVEHNLATTEELELVTQINGYSKQSLDDVIYARTGYNDIEQYLDEDEDGGGIRLWKP